MQQSKPEKINVTAFHAGFRTKNAVRRITPVNFTRRTGEKYDVVRIQRTYCEHVGEGLHVHFVIRTRQNRYFDIVYDNLKMDWCLVLELEDGA